jgi:hypothetical protein
VDLPYTHMLIASGDLSMYVVIARSELEQCSMGEVDGGWYPSFLRTSNDDISCEDDMFWTDQRSGDGCAAYDPNSVGHRYCPFDQDESGVLAETACRKSCGTCGSSGPAFQYCRSVQPEDPWISVGDHPDRVVYGEAGWCGHHWADDREQQIGDSGGSLEPPGPFLEPPGPLPTHLHTACMAYSERLPTHLNPPAERTCFP